MPRSARTSTPGQRTAATVRRVLEAVLGLTHPVEARLSPDGRTVAVTVARPEDTGVLLVPAGGPAARPGRAASGTGVPLVPAGGPAAGSGPAAPAPTAPVRHGGGADPVPGHLPRWLPDSRTLLLIREGTHADPGVPGRPELTAWDSVTGRVAPLAPVPGAVEELLVSDDGTEVLLLTADDGAERDGMNLGLPVRLGPAPDPETFRPGGGRRRLLHGRLPAPEELLAAGAGACVDLRDAGPPGLTVWNAAWRGGTTAVATVSEETLPAGYYHARLARVDLTDGSARTLYTPSGQLAAPAVSADGRRAVVAEGISIVAGRPVLVDLTDGTVTAPAAAEDATWLLPDARDPDRLLLAGWLGTGSRVADVRLDAAAPGGAEVTVRWRDRAVLGGPAFQPSLTLSADGSLAAGVLEGPGRPPQAVVAAAHGPDAWAWRPVTALNPDAVAGTGGFADLGRVRTRETSWASADGRRVHGLLLDAPGIPAPDGRRAGPRPLAVLVHGGPSWLWSAGHAPADVLGLAPALAAAGWLVLLPNPRGSSGYGLDHALGVVGEFGGRDLDDLLTGVAALTRTGEAAPGRTAVLGHSYGGYLAAVAAVRTRVFQAAVVVSAPADWLSFAHTSNIGGGYELTYAIGDPGTPEGRAGLIDRSPVFTGGVPRTPVLLLHGERDRVTPVSQAQELYRALVRRGSAPAELHVYPGEGHEFTDPAHILDAATRAATWLARHVQPDAASGTGPDAASGTGPAPAPPVSRARQNGDAPKEVAP